MLHIDGSQGEGGGQILRSSLALAMVTGTPFRITGIRAGRPKPGLMRQHLTCVQAAAAICAARVTGAEVGAQEVTFTPGAVRAGEYHFAVGTAGGTTLVLQAVLPALLCAEGPSVITVEGGTHNRAAPPFDFFERALAPLLVRAGVTLRARLDRHGFYPAGGGRVVVEVHPARDPRPVHLLERGARVSARAVALVSRLRRSIAERELEVLRTRFTLDAHDGEVVHVAEAVGPGNAVTLELCYQHVTEVFSAVGEIGKSAEAVASELVSQARDYAAALHPVGPHLADQLMVPLAVLAGGRYATGPLTEHARTNIAVIAAFGGSVAFEGEVVSVEPLRRGNAPPA
ncbi:RNA 3'-terminal phosphate cyclase [soil metagenome]